MANMNYENEIEIWSSYAKSQGMARRRIAMNRRYNQESIDDIWAFGEKVKSMEEIRLEKENLFDVSIAIHENAFDDIKRCAVEAGVVEVLDDADVSSIRDLDGHTFLRLSWTEYNHWSELGGNALLDIIREATKNDGGFAYVSIDKYGESEEFVGDEFIGLLYIKKTIEVSTEPF